MESFSHSLTAQLFTFGMSPEGLPESQRLKARVGNTGNMEVGKQDYNRPTPVVFILQARLTKETQVHTPQES